MRYFVCIFLAAIMLLTGCKTLPGGTKTATLSKFGPPDLFAKPIENVDIIAALTHGDASGLGLKGNEFAKEFDTRLRNYPNDSKLERNRIQNRLIMASNELCENYKVLLKKKQSRFNFWSGAAATLFGAAGSIATGAEGPQILAALSGATSGVRAEYNEQYFSDLAAHVITKGIAARRKEIQSAIELGQQKETSDYTIELAIADAIVYHGACSLVGGLEQADSTLSKFREFVGLDALGANPAFKLKTDPTKPANSGDTTTENEMAPTTSPVPTNNAPNPPQ
jgi:hypothetical protein